jgi:arginine utilization regulatory protein
VRRVGSLEEREVDLKLLSSVNEDPHAAIECGRLRLDLFYRLGVVLLHVPPLRERPEDLPVLTDHFLQKHNAELGRQVEKISAQVVELFRGYRWPGNVRELEHVVEGAMNIVGERPTIGLGDLPPYLLHAGRTTGASFVAEPAFPTKEAPPAATASPDSLDLRREQEEREQRAVEDALLEAGGNVAAAARRLGISRQLLRYKMAKHGLERSRFAGTHRHGSE